MCRSLTRVSGRCFSQAKRTMAYLETLEQAGRHICEIGQRMWQLGWVAANDGNISARLDRRRVLVTPTGVSKGRMDPAMLCMVDMDGSQIGDVGAHRPSCETMMHLAIYRQRPDVNAVVHAHCPHAVAFCITRAPWPKNIYPEVEVLLGDVPMAEYAASGTDAVARSIEPLIGEPARAVMLANHGPVTFGEDLETACNRMEVLEAYCRIVMLCRQAGEPVAVPPPDVAPKGVE